MKAVIRGYLDRGAGAAGLLAILEGRMRRGLTLLMYHRVLPDERVRDYPLGSLVMPESAFKEQMQLLASRYSAGTVGRGLRALDEGEKGKPLVAVTFDDGYRDNVEIAAPILEACGLRATFFVATDFVGDSRLMWFDEACLLLGALGEERARSSYPHRPPEQVGTTSMWMQALKALSPDDRGAALVAWREAHTSNSPAERLDTSEYDGMCAEDLRGLHRRGHEIGSHTCSHALLDQISPEELEGELTGSRERIEGWIGAPVEGFCYPNGNHDQRVRDAVQRAGYRWACTTRGGVHTLGNNPFTISRLDITSRRVLDGTGRHDEVQFRAELCRFHHLLRGARG